MENIGRSLPQSIDVEQSLLGAMILDIEAVTTASELLKIDDFYKESHKILYQTIINMYKNSETIDTLLLKSKLETLGLLDEVGGLAYISKLTDAGILTTNANRYSKVIEEKAILRRLIRSSSEIVTKGYNSEDADILLELAEKSIFDISQKKNRQGFSPINEILETTYDQIEALAEAKGSITGLSTGFAKIDEKTSGLQKSDLILVAARPSMGKTSLAINICQNSALEGATVAIFSLEMAKEQLVQRMLATEALIKVGDIRDGNLTEDDWISLSKASAKLAKASIFIDDTPGINLMEIRAKARRLKMEHGIDLIMIDYLQLMSSSETNESRQQEISSISRGLKALAREMECPVMTLSQLSRAPEQRADHRPILSDLRDSGAIEQDADIVMFLYRDEYYNNETEAKGLGELIIAKQRNGETGTIELTWLGQYTKFADLSREDEQRNYG
ncbi:MAG: replicative DNA helicase [Bacillota bacterium]|nr:replicative DNA helicase [Bacillota bacterium]